VLPLFLVDDLVRDLVSDQDRLSKMVRFYLVSSLVGEKRVRLAIDKIKFLLANSHASRVTHWLTNGLLPYLLSHIVVLLVPTHYNNSILTIHRRIIITLFCCLSKVFRRLVHSLVEYKLLLLKISLNRWILASCCSGFTLRSNFSHLNYSGFYCILIIIILVILSLD
jgi:hypothetical protein